MVRLSAEGELDVLELAETVFTSGDTANAWRLTGNTLTAQITGKNLQELNELAQLLENSPIVDRCSITNANKTLNTGSEINKIKELNNRKDIKGTNNTTSDVTATLIVYLQQPVEEEEG